LERVFKFKNFAQALEFTMSVIGDSYLEIQEQKIRHQDEMIRDAIRLKAIQQKFEGLLESAPDAVIVVGKDGTLMIVNSQSKKVFGYDRREILGKQSEILIPRRFRDKHPQHPDSFITKPMLRPMGAGLELYGRKASGWC